MIAEIPIMHRILKILLPTMFPNVISEFLLTKAKTFTTSSGADVPKATIVIPITIVGMLSLLAKDEALSTRRLAPKIKGAKPINSKGINHTSGL